jgi:hypothetical protein
MRLRAAPSLVPVVGMSLYSIQLSGPLTDATLLNRNRLSHQLVMVGVLQRVQWFNIVILTATPALALYGYLTTPTIDSRTLAFCILYYLYGMLGMTSFSSCVNMSLITIHQG